MSALDVLDEIYKTETVLDEDGNKYRLDSNIDKTEGNFLKDLILEHKPKNTIEVGCAYGLSSLFICSALSGKQGNYHTIVDPLQSSYWKNIGKFNLERAQIDFFEIIEKPSEIALPYLLSMEKKYDFGFIDGWHTFDHTLIDFFYLNRLLNVGGIIVIDDVGMPGVNKLVRYVLNYPSYELIGGVAIPVTTRQEIFDLLTFPLRLVTKLLPEKISYRLFAGRLIRTDKKLKIKTSMVAIRKIKEDDRSWSWYKEF